MTIDLRRAILDEIVLRGGNTITGYFPGTFQSVAKYSPKNMEAVLILLRRIHCQREVEIQTN